jgi:hypothetical protein
VNSSGFYPYRLMGKLTVFLYLQEFNLYNTTVDSSTSSTRQRSLLYMLFLVRLWDYIVNSCDFYPCRLIGKLTVFLYLQEFNLYNTTVDSCTSSTWLGLSNSSPGLPWLSLRLQFYVLCLNVDEAPITSKSHTHPSHSQTSRRLIGVFIDTQTFSVPTISY